MWRRTRAYRIWRYNVIRRYPRCVVCNSINNRQAHHINNGLHHPEDRFNIKNGITLCRNCHSIFHNDFIGSYRMKCTRKDWDNFVSMIKYLKPKLEKIEKFTYI
jgi:5-methylcytosine-specific restriction endonuclease McrA